MTESLNNGCTVPLLPVAADKSFYPVITVRQGDIQLNFLLDSGSTQCLLGIDAIKLFPDIQVLDTNMAYSSAGIDGKPVACPVVGLEFQTGGMRFREFMAVRDLSAVHDSTRRICGLDVHGLLGSDFMLKHGCVLDYTGMAVHFNNHQPPLVVPEWLLWLEEHPGEFTKLDRQLDEFERQEEKRLLKAGEFFDEHADEIERLLERERGKSRTEDGEEKP